MFKPGDVVRLKSGSRRLTVVEIASEPVVGTERGDLRVAASKTKVTVGWFKAGIAYYAAFPPEALYRPLLSRLGLRR